MASVKAIELTMMEPKAADDEQQHHSNRQNHHRKVTHNYHDHADDDAPPDYDSFEATMARSGANIPFPIKLYDMLEKVDDEGQSDIVSWQPHGR